MLQVICLIFFAAALTTATAQVNLARDNSISPAAELVDPFIGTGGHGHTFPGACVPNGMVQLSPDTRPDGYNDWDGCGGYHYSDSLIYGFSHTHLSGTGVADLCDVLLMPMSGKHSTEPAAYRSAFRKGTERAHAGYYRVMLERSGIEAELTATARVGVHRYAMPAGQEQFMLIDLRHRDQLIGTSITQVSDTEIAGSRRSSSWARDQQVYFVVRFSRAVHVVPSASDTTKAILSIRNSAEPLVVKVGISAVSIEGARKNLEAEVPHWDFDLVRKQAEEAWNAKLNKIQVEGGTREQQRTFYTALYHSYVAPYLFNDVDGQYRGMDGQVHKADHNVYTVFSLWDTFRALHPLMTVLEPEMTRDWIKTFLLHHEQGGRLPVWELWGNETDCMIGYHSVSVIADAYANGIRDFDTKAALAALVATAEQEHFGLKAYRERGYISSEDEPESVSRTLEYAYDDWCIARFAEMIGEQAIAERFRARSRNWQHLFDPTTGFFRARRNGGFVEPFDPYEVNFHFTEANAWQYGLFMAHDLDHYLRLIGGPSALTTRLDALFEAGTSTTGRQQSDITGLIGQYAHGNEPSHSFAYLYAVSDRPQRVEIYVDRILRELYSDRPDGLSGNEDCGQMSAWYVWSAMGLYPLLPGDTRLVVGKPLFPKVTLRARDASIAIVSDIHGGQPDHVEQVRWNDRDLAEGRWIERGELLKGGTLHFDLGPRAGSSGVPSGEEQMAWDGPAAVPILDAASRTFLDSLVVSVRCLTPGDLYYRINEGAEQRYAGPIVLRESATITARHGDARVTGRYLRIPGGRAVSLQSRYAAQYTAGGDGALVDGLRGGTDFRTGEWQGYEGQDVVFSVDLERAERLGRIGLSVLQDPKSWIWYPAEVEIVTSMNGRQWSSTVVPNTVPRDLQGARQQVLWTELGDRKVKYIRVVARYAGPCPAGHPGAGGTSWIFTDELILE
jgi:predicted alpha-1,2-mannosidase